MRLWGRRSPVDVRTPTVYRMGGGWGNRIQWVGENRIAGWKTPLPVEGDVVHAPMQSGKTAEFEMTKIEYCLDPRDMCFADVKAVRYVE